MFRYTLAAAAMLLVAAAPFAAADSPADIVDISTVCIHIDPTGSPIILIHSAECIAYVIATAFWVVNFAFCNQIYCIQ